MGGSYIALDRLHHTSSWLRVFSNGSYVGMIPDNPQVMDAVARTADGYGVNVQFAPIHTHVSPNYAWQSVASLPTRAVAVRYNGQVVAYTDSRTDARKILQTVKQALTPRGLQPGANVAFVGTVGTAATVVPVSQILDPDAAVRLLLNEAHGQLAGRSASLHSLTLGLGTDAGAASQTLLRTGSASSGSGLALTGFSDVIGGTGSSPQQGQDRPLPAALLSSPPKIQVQATETVTQLVSIPAPVHYVKDPHLGVGAVSVVKRGHAGKAREHVQVTFVNGMKVGERVLDRQLVTPPQAEVAKQGTNPGVAAGAWVWPTTQTDITSGFGWRDLGGRSDFHPGIDIGVPIGTPVYATNNGVVVEAGWNSGGYGNWVMIDNGNGVETIFGHLSEVDVHSGQIVAKGDEIGRSGDTGNSTGPHLHYEVRVNGTPVSPWKYT